MSTPTVAKVKKWQLSYLKVIDDEDCKFYYGKDGDKNILLSKLSKPAQKVAKQLIIDKDIAFGDFMENGRINLKYHVEDLQRLHPISPINAHDMTALFKGTIGSKCGIVESVSYMIHGLDSKFKSLLRPTEFNINKLRNEKYKYDLGPTMLAICTQRQLNPSHFLPFIRGVAVKDQYPSIVQVHGEIYTPIRINYSNNTIPLPVIIASEDSKNKSLKYTVPITSNGVNSYFHISYQMIIETQAKHETFKNAMLFHLNGPSNKPTLRIGKNNNNSNKRYKNNSNNKILLKPNEQSLNIWSSEEDNDMKMNTKHSSTKKKRKKRKKVKKHKKQQYIYSQTDESTEFSNGSFEQSIKRIKKLPKPLPLPDDIINTFNNTSTIQTNANINNTNNNNSNSKNIFNATNTKTFQNNNVHPRMNTMNAMTNNSNINGSNTFYNGLNISGYNQFGYNGLNDNNNNNINNNNIIQNIQKQNIQKRKLKTMIDLKVFCMDYSEIHNEGFKGNRAASSQLRMQEGTLWNKLRIVKCMERKNDEEYRKCMDNNGAMISKPAKLYQFDNTACCQQISAYVKNVLGYQTCVDLYNDTKNNCGEKYIPNLASLGIIG